MFAYDKERQEVRKIIIDTRTDIVRISMRQFKEAEVGSKDYYYWANTIINTLTKILMDDRKVYNGLDIFYGKDLDAVRRAYKSQPK